MDALGRADRGASVPGAVPSQSRSHEPVAITTTEARTTISWPSASTTAPLTRPVSRVGLPWFFGHLMWRGLVALGEGVVMSTGNEKTRRQRRKFTAQYRHEAARMVIDSGRTIAEVAQELGLGPQLLGRWVKAEKETMTPSTLSPDEREELKRLRKENADLRMDNEFLGKAAAFFAAKHQ